MKRKRNLLAILLVMTLIVGASLNVNIAHSAATTIYMDPRMVYALPGESFTVALEIADVSPAKSLHEWQVNMSFNPNVLEFINVTEGDFLKQGGKETTGFSVLDHITDGWALFTWAILGPFSESGSGTLATVEFQVLAQGESPLDFVTEPVWSPESQTWINMTHLTKMNPPPIPVGGEEMEDIPFTAIDGMFYNLEAPPKAIFNFSPENPMPDVVVTFNASSSYTTPPRELVEYYWDFGDHTNDTGMTVEHTFTTGGTFIVTLTVMDDANATTLAQEIFNTTKMPRIWYELYSSNTTTVGVKLGHDIAVTAVETSKTEVTVGETVSIEVTVLNKGIETEDFNVKAYYDNNLIETKPVTGLSPDAEETVTFNWDTTDVADGDYRISAEATDVEDEGNPQDNTFIDGTITVRSSSEQLPTTLIIGAVVVVAAMAILLFVFMRRRG